MSLDPDLRSLLELEGEGPARRQTSAESDAALAKLLAAHASARHTTAAAARAVAATRAAPSPRPPGAGALTRGLAAGLVLGFVLAGSLAAALWSIAQQAPAPPPASSTAAPTRAAPTRAAPTTAAPTTAAPTTAAPTTAAPTTSAPRAPSSSGTSASLAPPLAPASTPIEMPPSGALDEGPRAATAPSAPNPGDGVHSERNAERTADSPRLDDEDLLTAASRARSERRFARAAELYGRVAAGHGPRAYAAAVAAAELQLEHLAHPRRAELLFLRARRLQPRGPLTPQILQGLALVARRRGDRPAERGALEDLLRDYPRSSAAPSARARLETLDDHD